MTREVEKPKLGAGHASAMFRLGLAELRAAAVLSADSPIVQPSPYGIAGVLAPGEVMQERGTAGRDIDEQPRSLLSELSKPKEKALGRSEPERQLERE